MKLQRCMWAVIFAGAVFSCKPPTQLLVATTAPRFDAVPPPAATAVSEPSNGIEPLLPEAPERNPASGTVKFTLTVAPPVTAGVFWGAKKIGLTGANPLIWERPRGSGPVDITILAKGFLPAHTRLFSDRDDKINVRLFRTADLPPHESDGPPGTVLRR